MANVQVFGQWQISTIAAKSPLYRSVSSSSIDDLSLWVLTSIPSIQSVQRACVIVVRFHWWNPFQDIACIWYNFMMKGNAITSDEMSWTSVYYQRLKAVSAHIGLELISSHPFGWMSKIQPTTDRYLDRSKINLLRGWIKMASVARTKTTKWSTDQSN